MPIDYKRILEILDALSHPTRFMIVEILLKGEKCVSDIENLLSIKQPNISQHLSLLRLTGIVDWHQKGKTKCYFLKDPQLMEDLFKVLKKIKFKNNLSKLNQ